ncbi:hypothetical protein J18TS1_41150 [Oceanobacillus oncorhynchi subsp. incaldanensis]|nr:hypothetical protein J18TS1_41150 [Oceanobacillus oncorhynchi subsp. incaldanensis]
MDNLSTLKFALTKQALYNKCTFKLIPKGSSIIAAVVITGEILGTAGNRFISLLARPLSKKYVGKGLFFISFCRT